MYSDNAYDISVKHVYLYDSNLSTWNKNESEYVSMQIFTYKPDDEVPVL